MEHSLLEFYSRKLWKSGLQYLIKIQERFHGVSHICRLPHHEAIRSLEILETCAAGKDLAAMGFELSHQVLDGRSFGCQKDPRIHAYDSCRDGSRFQQLRKKCPQQLLPQIGLSITQSGRSNQQQQRTVDGHLLSPFRHCTLRPRSRRRYADFPAHIMFDRVRLRSEGADRDCSPRPPQT